MKQRILTAFVGLAVAIVAMMFSDTIVLNIIMALLCAAAVYEIVEAIMTGEKYNLLERLGALIADSLYQHYQGIVGLSVTVRKPPVPISGILDYVEVITTRGQI